jgi:hypothetical protein
MEELLELELLLLVQELASRKRIQIKGITAFMVLSFGYG